MQKVIADGKVAEAALKKREEDLVKEQEVRATDEIDDHEHSRMHAQVD